MSDSSYVIAWITEGTPSSPDLEKCGRWLMVRHKRRGWELPGGSTSNGESASVAMLRELGEETGLKAEIMTSRSLNDGGLMFWMIAEQTELVRWTSRDSAIEEVAWFERVPEPLAWGIEELRESAAWAHSCSKAAQ